MSYSNTFHSSGNRPYHHNNNKSKQSSSVSSVQSYELMQQLLIAYQQQQQQLQTQASCLFSLQAQNQQYYQVLENAAAVQYQQQITINNNTDVHNLDNRLISTSSSTDPNNNESVTTCEQSIQCTAVDQKEEMEQLKLDLVQEQMKNQQLRLQHTPKLMCDQATQCQVDLTDWTQLKSALAAEQLKNNTLNEQHEQDLKCQEELLHQVSQCQSTIERLQVEMTRSKQVQEQRVQENELVLRKKCDSVEEELVQLKAEMKQIKATEKQLIDSKNSATRANAEAKKELQKLRKQLQKSVFSRDDMQQLNLFNNWKKKIQDGFDGMVRENANAVVTMETRQSGWGTHLSERYRAWKDELCEELIAHLTCGIKDLKHKYEVGDDDSFDHTIMENAILMITDMVEKVQEQHAKQTNAFLDDCKVKETQALMHTQLNIFKAALHTNSVQIAERDDIIKILTEQFELLSNRK